AGSFRRPSCSFYLGPLFVPLPFPQGPLWIRKGGTEIRPWNTASRHTGQGSLFQRQEFQDPVALYCLMLQLPKKRSFVFAISQNDTWTYGSGQRENSLQIASW